MITVALPYMSWTVLNKKFYKIIESCERKKLFLKYDVPFLVMARAKHVVSRVATEHLKTRRLSLD